MAGKNTKQEHHSSNMDTDDFREMIAHRAYLKAKKRGFSPGFEQDDWLEAEQELNNQRLYWSLPSE